MASFRDTLQEAIELTKEKGFEQSRVKWLMLDLFEWSRTDYLMHMYDEVSQAEEAKFSLALDRMLLGKPIQYIVGFQSFYGHQLQVNSHCLIPRPETEKVMLYFLEHCEDGSTIADIGTDGGAIVIVLKKLNPTLNVIATDFIEDTLEAASDNAHQLKADIRSLKGNALKPLIKENIKLDGLISNPPYIDQTEMRDMEDTVVKYEPHTALFAEGGGYETYEMILDDLPKVLNKGAYVTSEIGYNQGEILKARIINKYPHANANLLGDINGLSRVISFKW